jgi:hypothetical protein
MYHNKQQSDVMEQMLRSICLRMNRVDSAIKDLQADMRHIRSSLEESKQAQYQQYNEEYGDMSDSSYQEPAEYDDQPSKLNQFVSSYLAPIGKPTNLVPISKPNQTQEIKHVSQYEPFIHEEEGAVRHVNDQYKYRTWKKFYIIAPVVRALSPDKIKLIDSDLVLLVEMRFICVPEFIYNIIVEINSPYALYKVLYTHKVIRLIKSIIKRDLSYADHISKFMGRADQLAGITQ